MFHRLAGAACALVRAQMLIFFNKKYLSWLAGAARALVRAQIADGVTRLADCRRSFSRLPTESRPCLGRSAQARNGSKFDFSHISLTIANEIADGVLAKLPKESIAFFFGL